MISSNTRRSFSEQAYPVTPDGDGGAVMRDLRGWLYRLLAPGPQCAVLQIGDGFAENWLPNVTKGDLRAETIATLYSAPFDMVVMHYSLGGLISLSAALASASRLLRSGGTLVFAGENRLRPATAKRADGNRPRPRKSVWGYRYAMAKAGFGNVRIFIAHPPGPAPVYLVDAHRLSAQAFFRTALRGSHLPRWSPMRLVVTATIRLNLMPYFESGFLVAGEKC